MNKKVVVGTNDFAKRIKGIELYAKSNIIRKNNANQEGKGYIFKEEDAGIFAAKLIRDDINFAMQNAEEKFNAAIEGKDEKEIKEIKKKYFDEKNKLKYLSKIINNDIEVQCDVFGKLNNGEVIDANGIFKNGISKYNNARPSARPYMTFSLNDDNYKAIEPDEATITQEDIEKAEILMNQIKDLKSQVSTLKSAQRDANVGSFINRTNKVVSFGKQGTNNLVKEAQNCEESIGKLTQVYNQKCDEINKRRQLAENKIVEYETALVDCEGKFKEIRKKQNVKNFEKDCKKVNSEIVKINGKISQAQTESEKRALRKALNSSKRELAEIKQCFKNTKDGKEYCGLQKKIEDNKKYINNKKEAINNYSIEQCNVDKIFAWNQKDILSALENKLPIANKKQSSFQKFINTIKSKFGKKKDDGCGSVYMHVKNIADRGTVAMGQNIMKGWQ